MSWPGQQPPAWTELSLDKWREPDSNGTGPETPNTSGALDERPQSQSKLYGVKKALVLPKSNQRQCKVPGCMIRKCKLGTHQKFKPSSSVQVRPRPNSEMQAHEALKQLEAYSQYTPSRHGVDDFPTLPVQETLDSGTRSLFHYFFTDTFDKLALLFRGPSVNHMSYFKERMLATALTSESYCRALILQAHSERERLTNHTPESGEALGLYSNALKAFQEQLAAIRQRPHPLQIELALLVICILMMFDVVHGRVEAQEVHWRGLRELVSMRGGMHCVGTSLAYVIHADRVCAIRFEEAPTYVNKVIQSLPMPMPVQTPPSSSFRHGFKYHALGDGSIRADPAVIEYLVDVSGLIDVWNRSGIPTEHMSSNGPVTSLDYLHYKRDQLDEQFALLNARWAKMDSIERCLLWASRIVEYPVTWSNYIPATARLQCQKLVAALQSSSNLAAVWRSNTDVLRWILFVLTVGEPCSEIRPWGIDYLRKLLFMKYGNIPWPPMWWVDEQDNLLGFTWSNTYQTTTFDKLCNELSHRLCDAADTK